MMYVEKIGHGPDLALLHGWGMHGGVWEGLLPTLAERHRVHVVDLPGHGASKASAPFTLAQVARDVAAALPLTCTLLGWSLGGQVALQIAHDQPERVARLVLIGTTPCFRQREDWPHGMDDKTLAEFARSLEEEYEGTLKRFLSLQARGGDEARAVIARLRESLFARGRPELESLRGGLNILSALDLRDAVSAITQPTLIVHGTHDMLTPLPAAQWLAQVMPAARLDVIPGAAHAPFLSHLTATLDSLQSFLHG
jgi:pimeloyl-[acyl-carrier protein] methyl ester esterase